MMLKKTQKEPLEDAVSGRNLLQFARRAYQVTIRRRVMSLLQSNWINCSRKCIFQRFQQYIFLATILLIPLVFNPWGFDMYEIPKNTLLKIGILATIIATLIAGWKNKKKTFHITKEQIYAIALFLLILGLSLIISLRPEISFWGSYFRQGGVVNMLFYIALFLLAVNIFKEKKNRQTFLKSLSIVGLIISVYAILQKLGIDIFSAETTAIFDGRSFSTLGNPTSLGAFLLFPIWGEIYLLFKNKNKKKSIPALIVMIAALICTRNRASMVALIATGFLALVRRFKKNKKVIAGIIAGVIIAGIVFTGIYAQDIRSLGSRGEIWGSSLEIIRDNPIHGYGMESFSFMFEKYVDADFFQYEDYENLVDRPHNEPLEIWIHLGLLGFIFYLGLVIFCLKTYWAKGHFAALAILSLFITNLFSFSLVTHYAFLVMFLALIVDNKKKITIKNNDLTKASAVVLIILMLGGIMLHGRIFLGDLALKQAFTQISTQHLEEAIDKAPYYLEVYEEAYAIYYPLAVYVGDEYLEKAISVNEKALEMSANSLKSLLNRARLEIFLGDYESAEDTYLSINENIAPHPLTYEHWGNMYFDWGLYEHAELIYDELLALMPNSWEISQEGTEEHRIFWKDHADFAETLAEIMITYEIVGRTDEAEYLLEIIQKATLSE